MSTNEIISRLKKNWKLKIFLSFVLNAMFAFLYLVPQHFPLFTITIMNPAKLDDMIPFLPASVYLYESLYLLMPIAPWLMKTKDELKRYALGIVLMTFAGFCFFFFLPTLCQRPENVQDANILYRCLISMDNELNAFPSLHVAFALFHCACCCAIFTTGSWHKFLRFFFRIWALGIIAATLMTKQHVFFDVLGGTLLGLGAYVICCQQKLLPWESVERTINVQ